MHLDRDDRRRFSVPTVLGQQHAGLDDQLCESKSYSSECDQIEWAINSLGEAVSKSVLDLGCGTGGHAYE